MNSNRNFVKPPHMLLFILTLAGLFFSGYLSAAKVLTGTCAFGETCPLFLGYPACWYGFGMYFIMFAAVVFALLKRIRMVSMLKINAVISFLGIAFAGNFAVQELIQSKITGALGLSTCVYGLIFYISIFVVSVISLEGAGE